MSQPIIAQAVVFQFSLHVYIGANRYFMCNGDF